MKRRYAALLTAALLLVLLPHTAARATGTLTTGAKAAVLMEKETGVLLYEQDAHVPLEPASVTKIMTLLLTMEALESGAFTTETEVRVSARAAAMGGSQVYLKEGETMTVHDLLKAVAVASGNDAAVALAELVAGSESAFVEKMNARAKELGMADTTFQNCTGLPAVGHLTSAYDIAVMSRELILNHPRIRTYSTIWMDTLREGAFQLTNTNKLVRFYEGCTGLKTGFTDGAGFCVSATAERDGMELIAVVLGCPDQSTRSQDAQALLSYGFSTYTLVDAKPSVALPPVTVRLGERDTVQPVLSDTRRILVEKSKVGEMETSVALCSDVEAPVEPGQKLGELRVSVGGEVVETVPLIAAEGVERLTVPKIFQSLLKRFLMAG